MNHRAHVGNGGGVAIYINGRQLVEQPLCLGRGSGEQTNGGFITKEFLDEFKGGEVTIALKSFLRYNDKYSSKPDKKIPRGLISLHLDEQKLPPMGDDLVVKPARVVPMTTSEWEAAFQNEDESSEQDPESLKFLWDGKWLANPQVMGEWRIVGSVVDPAGFDPQKDKSAKRPFTSQVRILDQGNTNDPLMLWSGKHLLNLKSYEAQQMQLRKVDGQDYLFIERGGFRNKPRAKGETPWLVFKPGK